MTRCSRLALFAVFASGLVGCSQPDNGAFCEQAEFFAARSVRDIDNHTSENQSATAFLDALADLRDLAPSSLRADLSLLVDYEQSYDPADGEQSPSVEVSRAGERVGSAIEQRCDLQLPYVRSDS